jgi:hypothetical protein
MPLLAAKVVPSFIKKVQKPLVIAAVHTTIERVVARILELLYSPDFTGF